MISYRYDDDNIYVGEQNCQLDPIASKNAGKDIFLLPANCTMVKPLEPKDGFNVVWKGDAWQYEEALAEEEKVEPYEPTAEEELEAELSSLDYEYSSAKSDILSVYMEAVINGETELMADLKTDLETLNAEYDKARAELEAE